jgi:hypothetical protein
MGNSSPEYLLSLLLSGGRSATFACAKAQEATLRSKEDSAEGGRSTFALATFACAKAQEARVAPHRKPLLAPQRDEAAVMASPQN